jgi:prolyl-tRNA editing enzyme YbaK/EbsC (Cys-tRNA(Pro) deacylase)
MTQVSSSSTNIQDLLARCEALERARFGLDDKSKVVIDESIRRARLAVERSGVYSAVWKFVPESYYTWPLEKRAACLEAPSIHNLCKSLLMENRRAPAGDDNPDPTNPKFILVVLQYASTLDVKKLTNAVRALRSDVKNRLDETQFDFRIASEEDNRIITGYEHNSVTPFGLLKKVPIFAAAAIEPLKVFWMGGGHEHLKLAMAFSEFCGALHPVVADISQPRTNFEHID